MSKLVDHHYKAIALAAGGIAILCAMDGVIKYLVQTNHVLIVTFGRYVFGALFAVGVWLRAGRPTLTREMWKAHSARGVVIAISATLFFWCLSVLPLAQVIVITFIAPLLVPFVARFLLGEELRRRSLVAAAVGFLGVLVAASGGESLNADKGRLLGVAGAIAAALTYSLSIVMLRGRAGKDGAVAIGVLSSLIPGALVAVPAIAVGELPSMRDLPAFLSLGLFASSGMYLLARAYAHAEAQVLAPLEYTALLWAALIGLFFFGETPHFLVWVGAAIIVAACLYGAQKDKEELLTPFAPAAPPPEVAE